MKLAAYLIIIGLIFSAAFPGLILAEEPEAEELEELSSEILDSADDILSADPNVTTATQLLAALPEPEERTKIAVYNIADKTGQYDDTGSPVITQGATDMMATALIRSRQFIVLDRINFSDFMNEQNLQGEDRLALGEGPALGEMTGADYVIEGAVTEYQVDREGGGTGLTIAGIGGFNETATASTAIDIRVTDTTSGEVVWSQSLAGEIEGSQVGLQAFSFLGDNIVEFETGSGKQEVINLVVRTLIEEAVFEIVESDVL